MPVSANGLIIAAPRSGSGKTLVTLGLAVALERRGLAVAPAKTGPDYIDAAILARVVGRAAVNLDPWAMRPERLQALAAAHAEDADLLLVEGVMGLFDGAADGSGSTGDLAATLDLPVILVIDAERQSQSIAPLAAGFARWRGDVRVAGVIVNRCASARHERMLRTALLATGLPVLGVLPRRDGLVLPERHLGLVLPDEATAFEAVVASAAGAVEEFIDVNALLGLTAAVRRGDSPPAGTGKGLPPPGQRIAVARDAAFAFVYPHWLAEWRAAGAEVHGFSPLAGELPRADADAVLLPGGYPELHAGRLAAQPAVFGALRRLRDGGALIYGECGGYMVLGEALVDAAGVSHAMAGLLPVTTRIDRPKRALGYRRLRHDSPLPWPAALNGHEFHYSAAHEAPGSPLFTASDALGEPVRPMGLRLGRVMGSYAHVIDVA